MFRAGEQPAQDAGAKRRVTSPTLAGNRYLFHSVYLSGLGGIP
jgi:hypothetical protein